MLLQVSSSTIFNNSSSYFLEEVKALTFTAGQVLDIVALVTIRICTRLFELKFTASLLRLLSPSHLDFLTPHTNQHHASANTTHLPTPANTTHPPINTPDMPGIPGYTLQDVESYARASCPAGFAIINNISKFTFVTNQFVRQDGSTFQGHALHVGYLDRNAYGDCWYAVCDPLNSGIAMYHGLPDHKFTPAGEPFSYPATVNNISDTIYPFSLAMKHPLSKAKDEGDRDVARQEKRVRLLLLVEFAHLLTGRKKHIGLVNSHGRDILTEFVALCELMQREKDKIAEKEAGQTTSTTEVKSGQASAQDEKLKKNINQASSVPKRDLKRKVATDDDPHTSTSQGTD